MAFLSREQQQHARRRTTAASGDSALLAMRAFVDNADSMDDDNVSQRKHMLMGVVFKGSKDDLGVQQQQPQQSTHCTYNKHTRDLLYGSRSDQRHTGDAASGLWHELGFSDGAAAGVDIETGVQWLGEDAFVMPSERIQEQQPEVEQDEDEQKEAAPALKRALQLTIDLPDKTTVEVVRTENDGAGRRSGDEDKDDPYQQLSPQSRRKRKNRDQMRQARQKEKVSWVPDA